MFESIIGAATFKAYKETEYRVHGDKPFTLRIGETSDALAAAHVHSRATCSAYITAFNPFSHPFDDETNARRHAALRGEIERRGLLSIEGVGQHPSNQWPGEASYLIFGLRL